MCAEIVAAVASMCDVVVVKDFRRDTLVGALFAMNMALYTEGGDVWSEADIGEWLSRAGCGDVSTLERPGVDEMVVLVGRPE